MGITSLDQLFRKSYGKIVARLTQKYGTHHLELIENATMDAYYKALKAWSINNQPDNPTGWLFRCADHALLDELRKIRRRTSLLDTNWPKDVENELDIAFDEVKDPELKLLFLVCHPVLKPEDRLALMLKTLGGLGDKEIASAFMLKVGTIKKRLLRSRQTIKEKELSFDWPVKPEISKRLDLVHKSLYLLFNEGFYSTHAEFWIRKDLCLEAMRLCKYLVDSDYSDRDSCALLALMCYHISRYESRLDDDGHIILLNEQDRTKWNQQFIKLGHEYISRSAHEEGEKTKYQLEAWISAQHCIAPSIEKTNWPLLKRLYLTLYDKEPSDLVLLNLVIVYLHLDNIDRAEELFKSISVDNFKTHKTIYYMVGVELYSQLKDKYQTELLLEMAIQSTTTTREAALLAKKLNHLKN